jgi:O-antigen/teichoic acid export membrane protein
LKKDWVERIITSSQGDSLRAQLLRGGVGVGILKMISIGLMLLIMVILARGLGPDGFGQYAFVIALVTTLSIPVAPAIMQLATREIAGMQQAGEEMRIPSFLRWANRHVWMGSFLIISVGAVLAITKVEWHVENRWSLLLIGMTALPLLGINAVKTGILSGLKRVVLGQFPELIVRPFVLFTLVALFWFTDYLNPATAMVAYVLGAAIAVGTASLFLKRSCPQNSFIEGSEETDSNKVWLKAWIPFALLFAASTLNAQIGILLLGWLSSNDQIAAMQIAEKGAALVLLSLLVVNQVIGPHITQVHLSNDTRRLQAISRQSARMAFVISLPIAIPLIFLGEPVLKLVFGSEYSDISTMPLAILASAQIFNVGFGSVGRLLIMSGHENHTLYGQTISLFTVVVFGLLLIPLYDAVGAAISIAIGVIVWNSILAYKVKTILGIRPGIF